MSKLINIVKNILVLPALVWVGIIYFLLDKEVRRAYFNGLKAKQNQEGGEGGK